VNTRLLETVEDKRTKDFFILLKRNLNRTQAIQIPISLNVKQASIVRVLLLLSQVVNKIFILARKHRTSIAASVASGQQDIHSCKKHP